MWKRMLCLITAAIMLLALAACGSEEPTQPATAAPTAAPTQPTTEAPTEAPDDGAIDLAAFIRDFQRGGTITEQVVYDAEGVTVTASSIRYDSITGAAILFKARNTTQEDILIQMDAAAVNGYMIRVDFSLAVAAGKSAEGEMTVPYTALALAGIDVIATVEFTMQLVDRDSFEVLADCAPAVIHTTAADGYEPVFDDAGQTVWDEDGVKIVLKGLDTGRQVSDSIVLIVYLYNGSDRAVSVQSSSVTVNGYEMTPTMTSTVMPGRHAVDVVTFYDPDLDEHDIKKIDDVEISFKIVEEETWTVIAFTDKIRAEL